MRQLIISWLSSNSSSIIFNYVSVESGNPKSHNTNYVDFQGISLLLPLLRYQILF